MPTQLKYFSQDVKRMLGKYKIRILTIWLSRVFWGVFMYRWERGWLSYGAYCMSEENKIGEIHVDCCTKEWQKIWKTPDFMKEVNGIHN